MTGNGNGWRNRIVGHGEKSADQFQAHPRNWRQHPKAQRAALAAALNGVGWVDTVIENVQTGHLLDGHERIWQALEQGDDTPVPYTQVDLTEDEEQLILATFDSITAMATTDQDMLKDLLNDLRVSEIVVDNTDLNALLHEVAARANVPYGEFTDAGDDPGAQIDRAEELREQWQTARGQVWTVPSVTVPGKTHRIMCGDSTSAEDVARLMDGEKAQAVVTDPPYGMRLDVSSSDLGRGDARRVSQHARNYSPVIGDEVDFDPAPIFEIWNASEMFLWGADYYADRIPKRNNGSWLVWDKRAGMEEMEFSSSSFELCWSKLKHRRDIIRQRWAGVHGMETQDTSVRVHPTQKPVEVIAWIIDKYSDGLVVDPFLGSGTTAVAAEQTGRICYGMELEPKYVAVTLERLAGLGLEPRLTD